jgi:hypothetical protein
MEQLKQLDDILKLFLIGIDFKSHQRIRDKLESEGHNLLPHQINELILFLEKKEYILIHKNIDTREPLIKDNFSLTLEGRMFILKDGFQGELNRLNASKKEVESLNNNIREVQNEANRLQRTIAFGTAIAAIYYLTELYLFCCNCILNK